MYKILLFLKRRPDMSVADFREYYEGSHVPLCRRYISGVDRYVRRFLDPLTSADTGRVDDMPFDVITELWFKDETAFRMTAERFSSGQVPDEIVADEMKLFDRQASRMTTTVEHETDCAS